MGAPQSLADEVQRFAHRCHVRELSSLMARARRFVLDEDMSVFLHHLAMDAFQVKSDRRRFEIADSLRRSARAPHPVTWVEYDSRARRREAVRCGLPLLPEEHVSPTTGWIIQEPDPGVLIATMAVSDPGSDPLLIPFSWHWLTDDTLPEFAGWKGELPRSVMTNFRDHTDHSGAVALGLPGYRTDRVKIMTGLSIDSPGNVSALNEMINETKGELRAIWALLATLNDIPVRTSQTPGGGSYLAAGRIRRYLGHTVVRLMVPGRQTIQRLARSVVLRARRARHEVRGHWRVYTWEASRPCVPAQHTWDAQNGCHCGAHRTWIAPHERGDASIGYVVHDYSVERGKESRPKQQGAHRGPVPLAGATPPDRGNET